MSKGSPFIALRIPADVLAEIDHYVSASTSWQREPHTRSSFILSAIVRDLAKRRRSRNWRRKPKRKPQTSTPQA